MMSVDLSVPFYRLLNIDSCGWFFVGIYLKPNLISYDSTMKLSCLKSQPKLLLTGVSSVSHQTHLAVTLLLSLNSFVNHEGLHQSPRLPSVTKASSSRYDFCQSHNRDFAATTTFASLEERNKMTQCMDRLCHQCDSVSMSISDMCHSHGSDE
jgi:hypothetical protein